MQNIFIYFIDNILKMRTAIIIFLSICFFTINAQQTIELLPTHDAYFAGSRGVNSDELRLRAGKQTSTLKFDITGLDIQSAKLELTLTKEPTGGEIRIYEGDEASKDWDETVLTLKPVRRSETILATLDKGTYTVNQTYSWDLSVDDIVATDMLTLVVLRVRGSKSNIFASKEHENTNYHPKLVIVTGSSDGGDNGGNDGGDNGGNDGGDNGGNDGGDNGGDNGGNDNGNNVGTSVWEVGTDGVIYYNDGKVGIGTSDPATRLVVDGEIRATKVRVRGDINTPDYVFEADYELRSIEEVEAYIKKHKHLPEVPSAEEIERDGLSVGDMDAVLLKKIEELTLYVIELKKEIAELKEAQQQEK